MNRLTVTLAATAALAGGSAAFPTAAVAQAGQGTVIIYGNDPCPRESICIRAPESQRYRIPDQLRQSGTPQQREAWFLTFETSQCAVRKLCQKCMYLRPKGLHF